MCGRYFINAEDTDEELEEIIAILQRRQGSAPIKTGEIFPSDTVPVIANNRRLVPAPFAMRWGYALPGGRRVINTRSETAHERPMFQDGMLRRRCLIPASHYFEWECRGRERIKYAIRPDGAKTLYMAGIYRIEDGTPVFSILTRAPAASIAFIHDRMPVILPAALREAWLSPDASPDQLLSQAEQQMIFGAVS